jgi:hypothetical protein
MRRFAVALAFTAAALLPALAAEPEILYDFSDPAALAALDAPERIFDSGAKECPGDPTASPALSGAFTRTRKAETVFAVRCASAPWQDVILESPGQPAIAIAVDPEPPTRPSAAADVERDGVEEVLLVGRATLNGVPTLTARLVSLRGGALTPVRDFGTVRADNCALGDSGARVEKILRVTPGRNGSAPEYEIEDVRRYCR